VTSLAGFEWRTNIALVGGFAAKEVIVSSLGTAYSMGDVDPEEPGGLVSRIARDPHWTMATALSLLVFVMLYAPCFVTVVTMARESSWRWAIFSTTFNTALAFVLAVGAYQLVSL
jgi:ferrous iron transport protein B